MPSLLDELIVSKFLVKPKGVGLVGRCEPGRMDERPAPAEPLPRELEASLL